MAEMHKPSYSIRVRLQRTTVEESSVRVPLTEELIIRQPDGTGRIDVSKIWERAVTMGQSSSLEWERESQQIQPHPVQKLPAGISPQKS